MRMLFDLVLLPLFIGVGSQLIAEWLIRQLANKRDKQH